jgi:hypothetical protein
MINPIIDSRSKRFSFNKKCGQVTEFAYELFTDNIPQDKIQPPGNVECTCYTICDIAQDKTGLEFQIDELFNRIPNNSKGADPKDAIKEVIKNGLLPVGGTLYYKPFSSFWQAHNGIADKFDNVRSALTIAKIPIMCWGPWYVEFLGTILPQGKTLTGYHCVDIEGWKVIGGKTYLIIEAWVGRKLLMDRETFNWWASQWGFDTAVLSDATIDENRTKTIMEKIIDLYNLLISIIKTQTIMPTMPTKITRLAECIRDYEGQPGDLNYRNNNPGNCRFNHGGYLPKYGKVVEDSRGFAIFPSYNQGWLYLQNMLLNWAKTSKANYTILQLMKEYAPTADNNDPVAYSNNITSRMGLSANTKLKELL